MISNLPENFNFNLGEETDALQESIRVFCDKEIAPFAGDIDKSNDFPSELWKKLGSMGLLGITVEEEFGGSGLGYLEHIIAMQEISRASASVGLSYGAHSNLCVNQICLNGNEKQNGRMVCCLRGCLGSSCLPMFFRYIVAPEWIVMKAKSPHDV